MAQPGRIAVQRNVFGILAALALLFMTTAAHAAFEKVTTYKDANGWKLKVDGRDFYVKGFVWGYTPRGENYTYNLWRESDEFIRNVLDHDFGLMAEAGVTAVRMFAVIPPKWITYIYEKYGIMSLVNPLMGRYGAEIGGIWRPNTNYADELTRETLKAEVLDVVERYKDVPGVLMFALGNESNYGLSWSSFEIEDFPVGEQEREKAKFLYSLMGEVIREGKRIAPNHLFTIVNGDIQYLDLIAEYLPHMDVLGANVYRGISFGDLWQRVNEVLDKPIVFMEFGSDAFNAKDFVEDQAAQASYLRGQWQEIYKQSYGNDGYGNAIGGFVFEWRDEWWKYKSTDEVNLDIHDRTASWGALYGGGYSFDYVEGQNNMNEEWFGITRLGELDINGVHVAEPRAAYHVLAEIWRTDPYSRGKSAIDSMINDVDLDYLSLRGDLLELKSAKKEADKFRLVGGSFQGEFFVQGNEVDIDEDGEDGLRFTDGQMAFLDFEFQPSRRIKGDFSINILANVADSDFEFRYGDRGLPITVEVTEEDQFGVTTSRAASVEDNERVEIYDFQASYEGDDFDLLAFYHVPRYHWYYEGDFFGLLAETTDMAGQDIWNAKAPYGFEFVGKDEMDGLKVLAGPEVYWGANPKVMVKYEFGEGDRYAFVFAEDIARRDDSSSATEATERQSRQATIYGRIDYSEDTKLELGGIIANTQKVGDEYDRIEGDDIVVDEIETEDALGFKARLESNLGSNRAYAQMHYAGLVADSNAVILDYSSELPWSALGNKKEIEGGMEFKSGYYSIFPRLFYRDNIVDANPIIAPVTSGTNLSPGIDPRNRDDDPFAVLDNREAAAAEIVFTYDPTPGSYFYDWDVEMIEDAPFAFNISLTATSYKEDADAELFFFEPGGVNASFGEGLAAEDVWLLKSKMIFNTSPGSKTVLNFYTGEKQSTGLPGQETVEFFSAEAKLIRDRKHIYSGYIKVDDFGPYDFYEQFNLVYPLQLKLEYARLLDQLRFGDRSDKIEDRASKIGVKLLYRELDELSPAEEFQNGENDYMMEIQTYFNLRF